MSIGPAEILVILIVALIVFGPQRLPEVGRQVGSAMRELRKVQDSVRAELDTVLHGDLGAPPTSVAPAELTTADMAPEEPDHTPPPALPPADPADGFRAPPDTGSFT